jgi:hypothetical protein
MELLTDGRFLEAPGRQPRFARYFGERKKNTNLVEVIFIKFRTGSPYKNWR